jgi:hypothetical protein
MNYAPLYAWVTLMEDGGPSIVCLPATYQGADIPMPLVGFGAEDLQKYEASVVKVAKQIGQPAFFVKFGSMEVLKSPDPKK